MPIPSTDVQMRPASSGLTYHGVPVTNIRKAAADKLAMQAVRVKKYTDYYDGEYPLKHLDGPTRDVFVRLLKESFSNWGELVVNAVAERLQVVGFRFGNDTSDDLAWQIWQASQMDADSEMGQTDSLVAGASFTSVRPDDTNPTGVAIDLEHASQCTVLYRPGNRRQRTAGYKRFSDDKTTVEVLLLPDAVLTWYSDGGQGAGDVPPDEMQLNPIGVVPVVELRPAPRTVGWPRSELESVVPIQDRINTTIYNRLVASDFGAFRQVTATGIKLPRTPEGAYAPPFNVGADRLLASENPEARFGVIPESSLRGYLDAVESDVQHMAAITQTPPHYLLGKMINIPGTGMKAAETGLVAKVKRRAQHLGEGWEETQRIALAYRGDPAARNIAAETVWADFESRSEGETVDALVKMKTLGVPTEVLWQRWGATPAEIKQWKTMAAAEQIQQATAAAVTFGATDPFSQLLAAPDNQPAAL